eukprot:4897302-Amphidinium_carterae.1
MGGCPVAFDDQRPWDYIWHSVLDETEVWQDQVREPVQCIQIGSASLSGVNDGDALVRLDAWNKWFLTCRFSWCCTGSLYGYSWFQCETKQDSSA